MGFGSGVVGFLSLWLAQPFIMEVSGTVACVEALQTAGLRSCVVGPDGMMARRLVRAPTRDALPPACRTRTTTPTLPAEQPPCGPDKMIIKDQLRWVLEPRDTWDIFTRKCPRRERFMTLDDSAATDPGDEDAVEGWPDSSAGQLSSAPDAVTTLTHPSASPCDAAAASKVAWALTGTIDASSARQCALSQLISKVRPKIHPRLKEAREHFANVHGNASRRPIRVAVLDTAIRSTMARSLGIARREDADWDFVEARPLSDASSSALPADSTSHAEKIAALLAARGGDTTLDGAWPDTEITSLRVVDKNDAASIFDLACAISHATRTGHDIIIISLEFRGRPGGGCDPLPAHDLVASALDYASSRGVVLVVASGNREGTCPPFPAMLSTRYRNIIVAGGHDFDGQPYGRGYGRAVSVLAPGSSIVVPQGRTFGPVDGTSYAVPLVAGAAAMLLSSSASDPRIREKSITDDARKKLAQGVRSALIWSGTSRGSTFHATGGYLNAAAALQFQLSRSSVEFRSHELKHTVKCSGPLGNLRVKVSPPGAKVHLRADEASATRRPGMDSFPLPLTRFGACGPEFVIPEGLFRDVWIGPFEHGDWPIRLPPHSNLEIGAFALEGPTQAGSRVEVECTEQGSTEECLVR